MKYNLRNSQTALRAQYVLTAYLTVFVVGVLLGMAFSPATPQERQWLAERSARLRAARELPRQASLSLVHQPHSCTSMHTAISPTVRLNERALGAYFERAALAVTLVAQDTACGTLQAARVFLQ